MPRIKWFNQLQWKQNNNQGKENMSETRTLNQRFILKNIYGANNISCHFNTENKVSDYSH